MDRLWAPWRLEYVRTCDIKDDGCVLCVKDLQCEDEKRMILERGRHCFVIMNIFPYSNGHLMIAPYRHTSDFENLTSEEKLEIMEMMARWTGILKDAMKCHGFNLGANLGRIAGAGIDDHIHFHIVPRWSGDTNFMPVIGNIKVLPESLDRCYKELLKKYREKFHGNQGAN